MLEMGRPKKYSQEIINQKITEPHKALNILQSSEGMKCKEERKRENSIRCRA